MPVKRKIVDVDGTGTTEDSRRQPVDKPGGVHQHVTVISHLELGVVTIADRNTNYDFLDFKPKYVITETSYLFSKTISGSHTMLDGRRRTLMSSNSDVFHASLWSVQL